MPSRVFDKEERGKALGYATASIYLGLSLGPVIGGVINNWFGWKTIILLVGIASAVTFVIACRTLPMLPASADMTINGMSCMLYIAGIVLSMYGFSNIGSDLWNYLILALGVILCVVFIRHESSVKDPILQVGLFKGNRAFTFSGFAALLNYAATYAVTYYLSIYLQMARGYSSQWAGMLLIVAPVVQTALSPVAGRLSDRMSPFKLSSSGMGICTLSLILLALVGQNTSIGIILVLQMLLGCGYALFSSPNTNAIMSSVSKDNLNLASSVLATMRTIGQTMSMGIVTIIVGLNMGSMAMSEASQALIVSTMKVIFIVFALICAAGVFLSNKRE